MRLVRYRRWFLYRLLGGGLLWLALLAVPAAAAEQTLLVFGDSLSAAYGIARRDSWPALLEERLRQGKFNWRVVNASISGETTAGGASRIEAALGQYRPALLVLALGANDGLRGLPVAEMQRNLTAMAAAAKRQGTRVLLIGMRLPPNYGQAYGREFAAAFAAVAREQRTALVPFLLEGFADRPEFFLADGLHPNPAAQPLILDTVWAALRPLLARR
jgi:acyl-CoA thioesterase-1